MNTISVSALSGILATLKGAAIVNLTHTSEVRMRKTGNPFVESGAVVTKRTTLTCQFGYSYKNAVENRSGEEFTPQPLKWGEWEIPNKIIAHKGKKYGRFYILNGGNKTETKFFVNGVPATAKEVETIREFAYESNHESNTQAEVGLTENQVKPMNIALDTIDRIKFNGTEYVIDHATDYALAK